MLFSNMWDDYVIIIFLVYKIYVFLVGEENMNDIVNDYVVFWIFVFDKICLDKFVVYFLVLGYEVKGDYDFEVKKFIVKYFEYFDDIKLKVFISEFCVNEFFEIV